MSKFSSNIKTLLGLCAAVLVFFACGESIIEVDLPQHEPSLVMTALIKDSTFASFEGYRLYFTSSTSLQESNETLLFEDFKDGNFSFYENGLLLDEGSALGIGFNHTEKIGRIRISPGAFGFLFKYGEQYQFNADINGYPPISSTQTMPFPPTYNAVSIDTIPKIDGKFTPYLSAHLTFKDDPDQMDFYHIQAYIIKRNNHSEKYPVWTWSTEDKLVLESYYDNSLVLEDEGFNGQEQTIELRIDSRFIHPEDDKLVLNFARMTEDSYRFHQSFRQHIISQETPFSEPITTYSNIENGFGIFGLEASTSITIIP